MIWFYKYARKLKLDINLVSLNITVTTKVSSPDKVVKAHMVLFAFSLLKML